MVAGETRGAARTMNLPAEGPVSPKDEPEQDPNSKNHPRAGLEGDPG